MVDPVGSSSTGFGAIERNQRTLDQTAERISSGRRINSAADDPAGFAIVNRINSQVDGFNQSIRNVSDGISQVQTAGGALDNVNEGIQRIRELSLQAANGTNNESDRGAINAEAQELREDISRTLEQTNFNGRPLFDSEEPTVIQAGPGNEDQVEIEGSNLVEELENTGLNEIDLSSPEGAQQAIQVLDEFQTQVDQANANFGAAANRFESTINNLGNASENAQASASRIGDADIAREVSDRAAAEIRGEVQIALRAQANQQDQQVLNLLS